MMHNMTKKLLPKVSFIIPTLNAANILPKCLTAIRSQDYPASRIEIVIADGGSTDTTRAIAKQFKAIVIDNPEVLHEPGKTLASTIATGEILFYTDADNILSTHKWLKMMVQPYLDNPKVTGFLPQTIPALDSNPLDRYFGYLFTDPFTWFIYGNAANPKYYSLIYTPIYQTKSYSVFSFAQQNYPLFGLSQGVGTTRQFARTGEGHSDDLLAGIQLMKNGGLIAYIPLAGIYHYHIQGIANFTRKYRWRVRNNIQQNIKDMGITQRTQYFSIWRKMRMFLFLPYAFSVLLPFLDSIRLSVKHRDSVMLWHTPACIILGYIILSESVCTIVFPSRKLNHYA